MQTDTINNHKPGKVIGRYDPVVIDAALRLCGFSSNDVASLAKRDYTYVRKCISGERYSEKIDTIIWKLVRHIICTVESTTQTQKKVTEEKCVTA